MLLLRGLQGFHLAVLQILSGLHHGLCHTVTICVISNGVLAGCIGACRMVFDKIFVSPVVFGHNHRLAPNHGLL